MRLQSHTVMHDARKSPERFTLDLIRLHKKHELDLEIDVRADLIDALVLASLRQEKILQETGSWTKKINLSDYSKVTMETFTFLCPTDIRLRSLWQRCPDLTSIYLYRQAADFLDTPIERQSIFARRALSLGHADRKLVESSCASEQPAKAKVGADFWRYNWAILRPSCLEKGSKLDASQLNKSDIFGNCRVLRVTFEIFSVSLGWFENEIFSFDWLLLWNVKAKRYDARKCVVFKGIDKGCCEKVKMR